jgi:methionyl-tRNA formyltransferase
LESYRERKLLQDESSASKAPKFEQEVTFIDWQRDTATTIYRKFQAFRGTNFRTIRTQFEGKVIFLEDISITSEVERKILDQTYSNSKAGSIWILKDSKLKNNVYVKTSDASWITIFEWKQFDRVPMPSHKFINQYLKKNNILENPLSESVFAFEEVVLK